MVISWLAGLNLGFFAWHAGLKHLKLYYAIPLTFLIFFESRNMVMKNCMDKIYYPLEPLYRKVRKDHKSSIEK